MPRRRPESPLVDRLAEILGMPVVGSSSVPPPSPLAGWVPQRSSVARVPVGLLGPVSAPVVSAAVVSAAGPLPSLVWPRGVLPRVMSSSVVAPGELPAAVLPPVAVPPLAIRPLGVPPSATSAEVSWASPSYAQAETAQAETAPPGTAPPGMASTEPDLDGSAAARFVQAFPDDGRHRRPGPPRPAILTIPVALRGVRAKPRRLAVLGVLVLLFAVAVVLGVRVAWAGAAAKPQSIAAAAHGPPGGLVFRTVPAAFATTGANGSPTATATASGVLMVHVVGQVVRPGVVRLPSGSRVLDAVNAAGGAKPSSDLDQVNLARILIDGEQIVVPKPGQIVVGAPDGQGAGTGSAGQGSTSGPAGALVNLNTADAAALDSLPGVGPVLSQRILDWRTAHGRFSTVDELGEVSGIGDKLLAQIGPKVTV